MTKWETAAVIVLLVVAAVSLILLPLAWRHEQRMGYAELRRRIKRARVNEEWLPRWMAYNGLAILGCSFTMGRLGYGDVFDGVLPVFVFILTWKAFHVRASRRKEFLARLEASADRICPECLYSLQGTTGDGTCPECGTAYTDEGLHTAWAFLHRAETKNQPPPA